MFPLRLKWTLCAATMLLMVFLMTPLSTYIGNRKSSETLAEAAGLGELDDDVVLISYGYKRYSALLFYANREVVKCDYSMAAKLLRSDVPVVMVTSRRKLREFDELDDLNLAMSCPEWCIVENSKAQLRHK